MADPGASGSVSSPTSATSAAGPSSEGLVSTVQEIGTGPQQSGMEVDVDVEAGRDQGEGTETPAASVVVPEGGVEGEADMEIQLDTAESNADAEPDADTAEDMVIEAGPSHIGKRVKVCH